MTGSEKQIKWAEQIVNSAKAQVAAWVKNPTHVAKYVQNWIDENSVSDVYKYLENLNDASFIITNKSDLSTFQGCITVILSN